MQRYCKQARGYPHRTEIFQILTEIKNTRDDQSNVIPSEQQVNYLKLKFSKYSYLQDRKNDLLRKKKGAILYIISQILILRFRRLCLEESL